MLGHSSGFEDISTPYGDPPPHHRGCSLIQTTEIVCPPETLALWPQMQRGTGWAMHGEGSPATLVLILLSSLITIPKGVIWPCYLLNRTAYLL